MKKTPNQRVLTGIRPTSNLTIANYIGAIKPMLEFQKKGMRPYIFVADIHALTDNGPEILKYSDEIITDLLALGIDPTESVMYKQSDIAGEVSALTLFLARHVPINELVRLPNLKDKVKSEDNVESANTLLVLYPVMMAADILVQQGTIIPVGKDQESHIEVTRKMTRKFNSEVADIFPIPAAHLMKMVKILSLRGTSKMSKSIPDDAIFLTDTPEVVKKKINRAETAVAGKMSPSLRSHMQIIKHLAMDPTVVTKAKDLIQRHRAGEGVMKEFKEVFSNVVLEFLDTFQLKRKYIVTKKEQYDHLLQQSRKIAVENARQTMDLVYKVFH